MSRNSKWRSKNGKMPSDKHKEVEHNSENQTCFVKVAEEYKGLVIGKQGKNITMIKKKSRAAVEACQGGFRVRGSEEQRESAKKLILHKVPSLVNVPNKFKGAVIGKGKQTLNRISTMTGVQLFIKTDGIYMTGPEEAKQKAEFEIKRLVAVARVGSPRSCCFVDDFNLPDNCDLKLMPEGIGQSQTHRLKLTEDCEVERVCCASAENGNPRYLKDLQENVMQCLSTIKECLDSGETRRNDMWCHFGTVLIRDVDEDDVDKVWTLEEASHHLTASSDDEEINQSRLHWHTAFKEGVDFDEEATLGQFLERPAGYDARHDLNFLTPSGRLVRCKVWVKDEEHERHDQEVPFSDVKNVLDEVSFRDERTNVRCDGWLCLSSTHCLKANISFPACNFDCRLMIRTRDEFAKERTPTDEEEDMLLLDYLSDLILQEGQEDELPLPDRELPVGFCTQYRRCCRRTIFPYGDFYIIVSKETTFPVDNKSGKKIEKKTDLHICCKKWDELLESGEWQPHEIVEKLPSFFSLVRKVQGLT